MNTEGCRERGEDALSGVANDGRSWEQVPCGGGQVFYRWRFLFRSVQAVMGAGALQGRAQPGAGSGAGAGFAVMFDRKKRRRN